MEIWEHLHRGRPSVPNSKTPPDKPTKKIQVSLYKIKYMTELVCFLLSVNEHAWYVLFYSAFYHFHPSTAAVCEIW